MVKLSNSGIELLTQFDGDDFRSPMQWERMQCFFLAVSGYLDIDCDLLWHNLEIARYQTNSLGLAAIKAHNV